jgi:hypothetical protein
MTAPAEPLLGLDSLNAICTPDPDDPLGYCVFFMRFFSGGYHSLAISILTWAISSFRIAFSAEPGCDDRVMVGNGIGKGKSKAGKRWSLRRRVRLSSRLQGRAEKRER